MTGRPNGGPVTAICIEVASPDLLTGWLDQGWMPQLRALRDAGAFLPLRSVASVSSGSIWPELRYRDHARTPRPVLHSYAARAGQLPIGKRYADDITLPPFWDALEAAGLETVLVDVPQTRPSRLPRRPHCWLGR